MQSFKLRRNHRFLSASGLVRQICKPLQHLKIHMFTYLKIFNDGSEINLSTHPEWIIDYYELKLYAVSAYGKKSNGQEKGFQWWPLESTTSVFKHGREYFDSYYGLTYCLPQADGCAFFFFSTSSKHYAQLEFYWNNLDLLEKFSNYFCVQATSLIKECEVSRLILPTEFRQAEIPSEKFDVLISLKYQREKFLAELQKHQPDPLFEFLKDYEPLTARERQCLDLVLKQLTAAQIAQQLSLSSRTVEEYLDRLKKKLQCHSKQALLLKLASLKKV